MDSGLLGGSESEPDLKVPMLLEDMENDGEFFDGVEEEQVNNNDDNDVIFNAKVEFPPEKSVAAVFAGTDTATVAATSSITTATAGAVT